METSQSSASLLHLNRTTYHDGFIITIVTPSGDDALTQKYVSDTAVKAFEHIVGIGLACLSLFGIATNSLSILAFLKESVDGKTMLSLMGLTISDMCHVTTMFMAGSQYLKEWWFPNLEEENIVLYIRSIVIWTSIVFTTSSLYITVLISVERSLCVVWPIKFKTVMTYRRTKYFVIAIYLIELAYFAPLLCFVISSLTEVHSLELNRSVSVWIPSEFYIDCDSFIATITFIATPITQIVVSISTCVMIHGLQKSSEFRKTSAKVGESSAKGHSLSEKEKTFGKDDSVGVCTSNCVSDAKYRDSFCTIIHSSHDSRHKPRKCILCRSFEQQFFYCHECISEFFRLL